MDVTKSERFEQLDRLLTEHDGMLQTAQVIASGIVKPIFYEYVKEKNLQQVAHGIYVSEDTWIDAMFLLHLRCGQAVFSHESALFFHDLTDREPSPYAITVRRGYSTTRLKAEGLSVYTIKPELYEVGLAEKLETIITRTTTNTRMRDFYDIYILDQLYGNTLNRQTLYDALLATAKKRGTERHLAEAVDVLNEVESSPVMQKLWESYRRKFSYAADLEWNIIMRAVRSLYALSEKESSL